MTGTIGGGGSRRGVQPLDLEGTVALFREELREARSGVQRTVMQLNQIRERVQDLRSRVVAGDEEVRRLRVDADNAELEVTELCASMVSGEEDGRAGGDEIRVAIAAEQAERARLERELEDVRAKHRARSVAGVAEEELGRRLAQASGEVANLTAQLEAARGAATADVASYDDSFAELEGSLVEAKQAELAAVERELSDLLAARAAAEGAAARQIAEAERERAAQENDRDAMNQRKQAFVNQCQGGCGGDWELRLTILSARMEAAENRQRCEEIRGNSEDFAKSMRAEAEGRAAALAKLRLGVAAAEEELRSVQAAISEKAAEAQKWRETAHRSLDSARRLEHDIKAALSAGSAAQRVAAIEEVLARGARESGASGG